MTAIRRCEFSEIRDLREAYLLALDAQVVHDAWHRRGRTTLFRLDEGDTRVGYAAVGGGGGEPHETLKEFYLTPPARPRATELFGAVLAAAAPRLIEAQTNDPFLAPLLPRFAPDAAPWAYLFRDGGPTDLPEPQGVRLQRVGPEDHAGMFAHSTEPIGDWGLVRSGEFVATGGLFFHYNPPWGDLYMEVAPRHRRRGYASYLLQELKRLCREGGHRPAARCDLENVASRRALERAGMTVCGTLVRGTLRP